jgi:peptide/nickel transport system substrate-binding protein
MNQIGYRARLVASNNDNYFGYLADSRHHVQAAFFGWVADDVTASDFFVPLFNCAGFTPNSPDKSNPGEFCSQATDRLIEGAKQAESSSTATAAVQWAQVDRSVVDAAPMVPLLNPTWVGLVSTHVHNYLRSPVLGVFFDQMWVR